MLFHKMSIATSTGYWLYSDKNLMDTAIAVSKRKFVGGAINMKKVCLQRALLISARAGRHTFVIVNCYMPAKWQTPKEYKDTVEEIRAAWQELTEHEQNVTTIVARGMNAELWTEEVDERGQAMKELLATTGIHKHIDSPPPRSTWTWRGPRDQRRCYDYIFANVEYKYEGAPSDIIKRGDHRAVAVQLQGHNSYNIFDRAKRDSMHSWRPTRSALERQRGFKDPGDHRGCPGRARERRGHRGRAHRQRRRHGAQP